MANETLYSSNAVIAAALDAQIAPMFTSAAIMAGLVAAFNLDGETNTRTKQLPKSGTITASVIAEASAATAQTLTDTAVTLTLQKAVVVTKPTKEAMMFAQQGTNVSRHAGLAAQACGVKFDIDAMALFSGFSQGVDGTTSMTVSLLQQAAYLVRAGNIPAGRMVAVQHYKQSWQLANDIRTSTGAFYGNPQAPVSPDAVKSNVTIPGFKGIAFGVELYESGLTAIDTAPTPDDNVGAVFCPDYAIAALYPTGVVPGFETELDGSVGFLESVTHIKTTMWYQLAEYVDTAGVRLFGEI